MALHFSDDAMLSFFVLEKLSTSLMVNSFASFRAMQMLFALLFLKAFVLARERYRRPLRGSEGRDDFGSERIRCASFQKRVPPRV
jgi:hypothetical protein